MRKGLARSPVEEEARRGHHPHVLRRVDRWGVQHAQVHQEHIACAAGHFDDFDQVTSRRIDDPANWPLCAICYVAEVVLDEVSRHARMEKC